MKQILASSAIALIASASGAFAVTTAGTVSFAGAYSIDSAPLMIGDTISVAPSVLTAGGTGDYAGLSSGTTAFDMDFQAGANIGQTFDFGDFTFTISSTLMADFDGGSAVVFGLGNVTGNGFDSSVSSYRFTIAGAQINEATSGTYSLFISTPPEDFNVIPVPAGLPLLVGGIAALGFLRRRKA